MKIIFIIAICLLLVALIIVIWGVLTRWKFVCNKRDNYKKLSTIPIYIINLNRSKDRWNIMQNNLKNLKIKNYNRFEGIDGKNYKLSYPEKKLFSNVDYDYRKDIGVVGCALSHFYLWKQMLDNNQPKILIVEDDMRFDVPDISKSILDNLTEYDIIFLHHEHSFNSNSLIIPLKNAQWYGTGAHAYIINSKAAKYLVDKAIKDGFRNAIDWFILNQYKYLKIGLINKPLFTQRDIPSIIQHING
tara:strand:+ start:6 stop:740 length:735 start_codon:yes stop_codon:yes gene_type:complete